MRFDWDQLIRYGPDLLQAFGVTIWISALSLLIGIVVGMIACLGKLQQRGLAFRLANGFIDFFRTIPEVVLIFWVYSCLPLLLSVRISSEACGIIALSLFSAAYLAEIFRAGSWRCLKAKSMQQMRWPFHDTTSGERLFFPQPYVV